MRTVKCALLAVILIAAFATTATAAVRTAKFAAGPGGIAIATVQVTATVTSVDQAKRTVTLKMPNGATRTFKVHKDVASFQQLKTGDKIQATLLEALAVVVRKSKERPGVSETTRVMLMPKGASPTMVEADTWRITGRIQSVDTSNRTVTVTGPNQRSRVFKVGPNVNLSKLKAGDDIIVRFTEALAISLHKPMK